MRSLVQSFSSQNRALVNNSRVMKFIPFALCVTSFSRLWWVISLNDFAYPDATSSATMYTLECVLHEIIRNLQEMNVRAGCTLRVSKHRENPTKRCRIQSRFCDHCNYFLHIIFYNWKLYVRHLLVGVYVLLVHQYMMRHLRVLIYVLRSRFAYIDALTPINNCVTS